MREYVEASCMKKISQEEVSRLEKLITAEELSQAVSQMPRGKALSPDGLIVDYYRKYKEILKPDSHETHNSEASPGTFSAIIEANKNQSLLTQGGDMLVPPGRSALRYAGKWPSAADGTVPVPYALDPAYNGYQLNLFKRAFDEFQTLTCIRFIPRTTENDYVNIVNGGSCTSYVGKIGGGQFISLGGGCMYRGVVQHELDHALGFVHEHMRDDRDNYVTVLYQFIAPEYYSAYNKMNTDDQGLEYDHSSVMHYDNTSFANTSGQPTMVAKPDPNIQFGQRDGLSVLDVSKINRRYNCNVCANLLNKDSGVFTSANYPSPYPNNVNCVWLIRTPTGQVSLNFVAFNLQSSPGCTTDYIKIYDGPTKSYPVLLDNVCGNSPLPQIIASTNQMLVEFVTDSDSTDVGFKATYNSVPCGANYFYPTGIIASPGYPNNYPTNMNACNFTITAPPGMKVSLKILDFYLDACPSCVCDNVRFMIYDNKWTGKLCGYHIFTNEVISATNVMVIQMTTDFMLSNKGWKASYSFIQ
ncbi:embryonic protein UVS.2-like [Hyperolius riggenbachi]|uniref:embryonic protein UVS.2-like n=1 Tax=Hyperolius riggenbachi TaxID=752182 RepID=UPI0035A2D3ED